MSHCRFLAAVSAFTLVLAAFSATPSQAQCVQTGADVACPADDADGFASTDDDLVITVDPGVTVSNDDDAFELDDSDGISLTNNGAIVSTGDRGIDTDDDATILNTGTIAAEDDAIRGDNDLTVTNAPGATITSATQEGVDAGDGSGLLLNNFGTIDVGDEGVQAGLEATINNDGTIRAVDDAIQVQGDGNITNSGLIESTEGDGIDIDTGEVENTGTIRSLLAGEAGIDIDVIEAVDGDLPTRQSVVIANQGLIEGDFGVLVDPGNAEDQFITNLGGGIIRGTTAAIQLAGGDDTLDLIGDTIIDGDATFGAGDDLLRISGLGTQDTVGGRNAFFDGGEDTDLLIWTNGITLDDITVFAAVPGRGPDAFRIGFTNATGTTSTLFFQNFEGFVLGGVAFSAADIAAVAPVPLPAGGLLLLSGLGLAGLVARRRQRA